MGRRRGSSSSNFAQGGTVLDLFTTDNTGAPIPDSDVSSQSGLFKGAIQNYSYLFNPADPTKAYFEEANDLNGNVPLFDATGDLKASLDLNNQVLKYEVIVVDDLEFRYPFEFELANVRDELRFNDTQIEEELVNSLESFSDLIDAFVLPGDPLGDSVGFLPFFEGKTQADVEDIYPNLADDTRNFTSLLVDFGNPDVSGQDQNVAIIFEEFEEDVNPLKEEEVFDPITQAGNDGNETFQGGSGDDFFYGNGGLDRFFGEAGDDSFFGGNQADEMFGGDGNDTLFGNDGSNLLVGGSGDDVIYGGNQVDTIFGGSGDDTIYDNSGDDFIDSGSGFDLIRLGGGKDIVILSEGEGYDTIENYQLGMTTLQGFDEFELSFVDKGGNTEIFKGSDQLAVVRWQTTEQISGGLFVA